MRTIFICILTFVAAAASAQRKPAFGLGAGWHWHNLEQRRTEQVDGRTGGWNLAAVVDYPITSRLSLHGQLGLHLTGTRSLDGRFAHRAVLPELVVGATEYLPVGGGAFFTTFSAYAGPVSGQFRQSGARLADSTDFGKWRSGLGIYVGYQFANGTFLRSGLNTSLFTNYYRPPNGGNRYFDWSLQVLQLGHYFNYRQRSPRFFKKRGSQD